MEHWYLPPKWGQQRPVVKVVKPRTEKPPREWTFPPTYAPFSAHSQSPHWYSYSYSYWCSCPKWLIFVVNSLHSENTVAKGKDVGLIIRNIGGSPTGIPRSDDLQKVCTTIIVYLFVKMVWLNSIFHICFIYFSLPTYVWNVFLYVSAFWFSFLLLLLLLLLLWSRFLFRGWPGGARGPVLRLFLRP